MRWFHTIEPRRPTDIRLPERESRAGLGAGTPPRTVRVRTDPERGCRVKTEPRVVAAPRPVPL